IYTVEATNLHPNYLLGEVRNTGWWWYFPFAMLVKTPLATLTTVFIAAALLAIGPLRRRLQLSTEQRWALACIAIASALYLLAAARQNINYGVRHVLPLYPLFFAAVGVIFSRVLVVAAWRKPAGFIAA